MEAVSLVCNMPHRSDHNVGTGDVTRAMMMSHSMQLWHGHNSKDHGLPQTFSKLYKQICRNLLPRRIHKTFLSLIFIKRRSFVWILFMTMMMRRRAYNCGPHHAACESPRVKFILVHAKLVDTFYFYIPESWNSRQSLTARSALSLLRSPPAPLSSGSRQFMTVK